MAKQEYAAWQAVTKSSETRWIVDEVQWANHKRILCYKGGEDGVYIEADPDGKVTIGNYEGADPCITDALFYPKHSKVMGANASEAFGKVTEKLGLGFLVSMMGL